MTKREYAGKTAEIYFNSPEQKEKYYEAAKSKKSSFSKYVLNVLEEASQPLTESAKSSEELQDLKEKYRQLLKSNRDLARELERQTKELQRLKDEAFLQPSGEADLDPDLLSLLQAGPIHSPRLLEALKIDPADAQKVRAITRQLEMLEATGFIGRGPRGWRWQK